MMVMVMIMANTHLALCATYGSKPFTLISFNSHNHPVRVVNLSMLTHCYCSPLLVSSTQILLTST